MTNTSRRSFMKNAATFAAATTLVPNLDWLQIEKPIGIQLWSVKEEMADNPEKTLKALGRMGFQYLEGFGLKNGKLFDKSLPEFRKMMKEHELKMSSIHNTFTSKHYDSAKKTVTDAWKKDVEDAKKLGCRYIISPWTEDADRKSADGYKEFCDMLNKAGEYCKEQEIRFGYHNHAFEFQTKWDGKMMHEVLMENTNPEVVTMELDWMWAVRGGQNVVELFNKYPNRFELGHVKDLAEEGKDESIIVGEGVIDFEAILTNVRKGGTKMLIVELEHYQKDPVSDVKVCLNNLRDILDDVEKGKLKGKKKKKK
jgi:sugar phosphate isomerase/epimerase